MRLARDLGLLDGAGVDRGPGPRGHADDELCLVHDPRVRRRGPRGSAATAATTPPTCGTGWAPPTTRCSPGCTRRRPAWSGPRSPRCEAVWSGRSAHAVNLAGGLHHAMRDHASGFCVYNDAAAAIQWALDAGRRAGRVRRRRRAPRRRGRAGVLGRPAGADRLAARDRPRTLFPGTGFPDDVGGPAARGHGGQRRAAARHRRRRLAARLRRGRAAAAARVPARSCWSPSTAATATRWTRSPTSRSASTASAPRTPRCTRSRTSTPTGAGWRSAAAGTRTSRWCRAPGPTWSARSCTRPVAAAVRGARDAGGRTCGTTARTRRTAADDRRRRPAGTTVVGGPGRSATRTPSTEAIAATRRATFPLHGLDPFGVQ